MKKITWKYIHSSRDRYPEKKQRCTLQIFTATTIKTFIDSATIDQSHLYFADVQIQSLKKLKLHTLIHIRLQ